MTAPNHIAGGIVFTGIFCSFFSINIFASPVFIVATVLGSLLPDIDHTKSWIGKSVFPIAKWLSRNYGHRTITHSIFFLLLIYFISLFIDKLFFTDTSISTIILFSVLSHLIFDMVTLAGIPLFYPFYKNPCVLPANPDMRIRSGNIRQEGIILFIFCFLSFFLMDLFQNGFWSTINNNFNDVKHQISEYKKSTNALNIEYDYTIYQNNLKGNGILLQATNDEIFILDNKQILSLKKNTPGLNIKTLKTTKTKKTIIIKVLDFNNYTEYDLNKFLDNKFITSATIYSNYNTALTSNPLEINKKFTIDNKYDLEFKSSFEDTLFINREKKIAELKIKLKNEENQLINDNKSYYSDINMLKMEKEKLQNNLSNFEINEIKKNIIELEKKIQAYKPKTNLMIPEYINQINQIKKGNLEQIKYSGKLYFISIV